MKEIFGEKQGDVKIKGLTDCENEEKFEEKWEKLAKTWATREGDKKFAHYFLKNKKEKIKVTMILSIRTKCGLRYEEYTQNANECANSVLKRAKGSGLVLKKNVLI